MPEFLPKREEYTSKEKGGKPGDLLGKGRDAQAYIHKDDEEKVVAFNKEAKSGDVAINLKRSFYCHKILQLLFPKHFSRISFAGRNQAGEVGTIRGRIQGEDIEMRDMGDAAFFNFSPEIQEVDALFKKHGITIGMEGIGAGNFKRNSEDGTAIYVDTLDFIRTAEDVSKLKNVLDDEYFAKALSADKLAEVRKEALAFAERNVSLSEAKS